jgi:opacity protein-like surface antigen
MHKLIAVSSALTLSLATFAAQAEENGAATTVTPDTATATASSSNEGPKGFELGARLGFGLPLGSTQKGSELSDGTSGQIPLWIDAGYRITPNIYVGAYGQLGHVLLKDAGCANATDCGAQSYRIGANAHYHFMPSQKFDPWAGVGIGYEWLHASGKVRGADVSSTTGGFEFVNLQLGGDYRLSPNAAIGPFASFSVGQFSSNSVTAGGETRSSDIEKTALHEWLTLGVRGVFDL